MPHLLSYRRYKYLSRVEYGEYTRYGRRDPLTETDIGWRIPYEPYIHDYIGGGIDGTGAASQGYVFRALTGRSDKLDRNAPNDGYEDQYLKERGDDLLKTGIDPCEISRRTTDRDPYN